MAVQKATKWYPAKKGPVILVEGQAVQLMLPAGRASAPYEAFAAAAHRLAEEGVIKRAKPAVKKAKPAAKKAK